MRARRTHWRRFRRDHWLGPGTRRSRLARYSPLGKGRVCTRVEPPSGAGTARPARLDLECLVLRARACGRSRRDVRVGDEAKRLTLGRFDDGRREGVCSIEGRARRAAGTRPSSARCGILQRARALLAEASSPRWVLREVRLDGARKGEVDELRHASGADGRSERCGVRWRGATGRGRRVQRRVSAQRRRPSR